MATQGRAELRQGVGQGRRLKAEWEEHSAVLLAFPHAQSDWSSCLDEARACFLNIIEHILCFESALVCVDSDDDEGFGILCESFGAAHLFKGEEQDRGLSPKDRALCERLSPAIAHFIVPQPKLLGIASESVAKSTAHSPHALHIVRVKTNDTWARDFGGISVEVDSEMADFKGLDSQKIGAGLSAADSEKPVRLLDFGFNGWGLKFAANYDNLITQKLFKQEVRIQADMVLEGGSIESNGEGVLLTNTQCLLEPNRNPHLSQAQIEERLRGYFGLDSVLWLESGYLAGDDTDSHIDTLARFIAPDTIAYVKCEEESDEHYGALAAMESELKALKTPSGEPYKLVALPFVGAIYERVSNGAGEVGETGRASRALESRQDFKASVDSGVELDSGVGLDSGAELDFELSTELERLPATYANFLFVNGGLLVPTYNDPNDALALEILSRALPHLKVVGVDCRTLIKWHGSLHCVTMQLY